MVIEPYPVLLTCTHPEYHTDRSFDALAAYSRRGGKLMYLGGNGFDWRIATHRSAPGILDIRRGEIGMRAGQRSPASSSRLSTAPTRTVAPCRKAAEPDQRHRFQLPGKVRVRLLPPASGVEGSARQLDFDGVDDDVIGDFGLCGQGAAGYELDRADQDWARRRTRSSWRARRTCPGSYVVVPEDLLDARLHLERRAGQGPHARRYDLPRAGRRRRRVRRRVDHLSAAASPTTATTTTCRGSSSNVLRRFRERPGPDDGRNGRQPDRAGRERA